MVGGRQDVAFAVKGDAVNLLEVFGQILTNRQIKSANPSIHFNPSIHDGQFFS
jgi:hypothetical protein